MLYNKGMSDTTLIETEEPTAIEGEVLPMVQDNSGGVKITPELSADLTLEEQTFCSLVSKGYSGVTAYRNAFPAKKHLKYSTIRVYASELLTKANIVTEVAVRVETASRLARLAEGRLEDILVNDDSQAKGNKVADVAMFMYEQANGKATQRVEMQSKHVSVTYNLSGTTEPVPQEILDQLEDSE